MESWGGGTEVDRRCPCASASRRPPRLQGDVPRKPPNNVSRHNSLLPHEQPQWSPRAKGSTGIGPRSPRSTGAMLQFASRVDSPESNRLSAAARCSSSRQLQQEAAAGMPGGCLHKTSSTGSLPIRARDPSPFRAGDVEWFREESPPPRRSLQLTNSLPGGVLGTLWRHRQPDLLVHCHHHVIWPRPDHCEERGHMACFPHPAARPAASCRLAALRLLY